MDRTDRWLNRLHALLEHQIKNSVPTNREIAEELAISERQLFRKVREATGLSPQKYITKYRIQQSMSLLKSGKYRTVKEVATAIGYKNVSHFIRLFTEEFGRTPLKVLKTAGWR